MDTQGHATLPRGAGGGTFFHGKVTPHTGKPQPLLSGRGSRQGRLFTEPAKCHRPPKLLRKAEMLKWKVQRTSDPRGTSGPGRLGTTERRGGSLPAVGVLTPSGRAARAAPSPYLTDVMASPSSPTRSARVRCSASAQQRQQQVPRQLLLLRHSATAARPHTPRRGPRPPGPRADWPRPQGTPRPGPAAAEGPGARAARSCPRVRSPPAGARLARGRARGRRGHLEPREQRSPHS